MLRDEITDYIDSITNLSVYLTEANKIITKLLSFRKELVLLFDFYSKNNQKEEEKQQLIKLLAFTEYEKEQFQKIFGSNWLKSLYEIVKQSGKIHIEVMSPDIRYYTLSSEFWIRQIKESLVHFWGDHILNEDVEFHIISSNTHSVLNCLSPWIQNNRDQILSWAESEKLETIDVFEPADQLYAAAKKWLEFHPNEQIIRDQMNAQYGIHELADTSFTGIKFTLVDVTKLSNDIDPHLRLFFKYKKEENNY